MKYFKQFMIILSITFVGEFLNFVIPLPIPAGIYGMVILFILLQTGVLKLSAIKETSDFLLKVLPVMFIPAGVGLITTWDRLRPLLLPLLFIIVFSTFTVMISSGHVTQFLIRKGHSAKKGGSTHDNLE